jgi:hypothetical protein
MKQIDLNRMSELLNGFIAEEINKQDANYQSSDIEKIDIKNLSVKVPEDFFTNINLQSEREVLEKKLEELQLK